MSELDVCFSEALAYTASVTSGNYTTFRRHLDPDWIEEALATTGTATLRRRRLPAEQVVWLVVGMALVRDRSIKDVVRQLDLAMPSTDGMRTVASSAITQARARLGSEPLEWLFERTAIEWAHRSADQDRWRGLALFVSLDDEMGVIPLQTHVDHAEVVPAVRRCQRRAKRVVGVALAETLDVLLESHGDVSRCSVR